MPSVYDITSGGKFNLVSNVDNLSFPSQFAIPFVVSLNRSFIYNHHMHYIWPLYIMSNASLNGEYDLRAHQTNEYISLLRDLAPKEDN